MIPKVIPGGDVDGLVRYLYSPGRANEHENPRIIDGWRPSEQIEPRFTQGGKRDLRQLIDKLDAPNQLMRTPRQDYVRHIPLAAGRETTDAGGITIAADRELTDAEFSELAREVLHRTGIAPRGDDQACRWILVRHGGNHAHLVATLAREDGGRCDPAFDRRKSQEAARAFERRHPDLRQVRPADRTGTPLPNRGQQEKANRVAGIKGPWDRDEADAPLAVGPKALTAMESLQNEAYGYRAMSRGPAEFLSQLSSARAAGEGGVPGPLLQIVQVRVEGSKGLVDARQLTDDQLATATGWAVHRVGDVGRNGRPIYYTGTRLGPDLSINKLKEHWSPKTTKNTTAPAKAALLQMRRDAGEAAGASRSWEEYARRLRDKGIVVKERFSTINPGEITGYSIGLQGHCDPEAGRGMVKGSDIKADGNLSYQKLLSAWRRPEEEPLRLGKFLEPQDPLEWAREAGTVARNTALRLQELAGTDPGAAGDAASSAADLLRGMARIAPDAAQAQLIEDAAKTFRSAGRELNRGPIRPGPGGRALRMLGKTAFFLRAMGDSESADWARLVVSTGMILRAVGDIRLAQGRLRDQEAALGACRKLEQAFDLAIGINPSDEPGLKRAKQSVFTGGNPWAGTMQQATESVAPQIRRPIL